MNAKARTMLSAFHGLPAGATIVEIGCVRFRHDIPSDGYSTVHLGAEARQRGWIVHSVDIDPVAVENARDLTAGMPVTVHEADGEAWLACFADMIDGLYLDGSASPEEALAQYEAAARADGPVVVVIDDVQAIAGTERGKGNLLLDRLIGDLYTVEIVDTEPGYRMAVAHA